MIENQSLINASINAMRGREEQRTRRGCISYMMRLYIFGINIDLRTWELNEKQKCLTS